MLQMRLQELGYYHGTITGGYYGGTIKAVEAFQRDHGLSIDGAAGQQTQSLLFSAAVDPTPAPSVTLLKAASASPMPTATPISLPSASPLPAATDKATAIPAPTPFAPLPGSVG